MVEDYINITFEYIVQKRHYLKAYEIIQELAAK